MDTGFMTSIMGSMRDLDAQRTQDVSKLVAQLADLQKQISDTQHQLGLFREQQRHQMTTMETRLEHQRQEFVDYRAEKERQAVENKLEHAEIEKKNIRRGWLQVIISLVLGPLITLCIEHFEAVAGYFRALFH